MISIITVHLNQYEDLLKTSKSIEIQSYQQFKWILIDGYSDKKIREKLNKINRIDNLVIEKDEGIYDAMNKGLKFIESKDFVLFLNAGDEFAQSNILQQVVNRGWLKNAEIVYGNCLTENGLKKARSFAKSFFSKGMPFCHQACFVKGSILKKEMFRTNYKYAADLDFFFRVFNSGENFKQIDLALIFFKSGGASDINRLDVLMEWHRILGSKIKLYFFYRLLIEKLKSMFQ